MKTISFLASHGGSAAKTIIQAMESKTLKANIGIVITNNRDSAIYQWCSDNKVKVFHLSGKTHPDDNEKDKAICDLLTSSNTDLIILSGYMKKIGPMCLSTFENKIMNIHPSLLPAHGGKGMFGDRVHKSVLASGDKKSGATVQLINSEYDEGPIIIQRAIKVFENDTLESLKARVQEIEGILYIEAIKKLAN